MTLSPEEILASARNCLDLEEAAIKSTSEKLDDAFVNTIRLIEGAILDGGKLVFTGVGKNVSGLGRRMAPCPPLPKPFP